MLCVVHAHDQTSSGELNAQTLARCQRATVLWHKKKATTLVIVAGTRRNDRRIADAMKDFCIESGIPRESLIVAPCAMNTAGEIDACLELFPVERHFSSISSWYHVPRIYCLWRLKGYRATVFASIGGESLWDILLEMFKFPHSVLRPNTSSRYRRPVRQEENT